MFNILYFPTAGSTSSQKKDRYRREGRRCCLEEKIYSILYNSSLSQLFCTRRFEEQDGLQKRINVSYSSKQSQRKIASAARNLINSVPQTAATTVAFSSVFILILCTAWTLQIGSRFSVLKKETQRRASFVLHK